MYFVDRGLGYTLESGGVAVVQLASRLAPFVTNAVSDSSIKLILMANMLPSLQRYPEPSVRVRIRGRLLILTEPSIHDANVYDSVFTETYRTMTRSTPSELRSN